MTSSAQPNFYELLGISQHATTDEIRVAWRETARRLHPDTAGDGSSDAFLAARQAYETLSDAKARRQYDVEQLAVRLRASTNARYTPPPTPPPPPPPPPRPAPEPTPYQPSAARSNETSSNNRPDSVGLRGPDLHTSIVIDFRDAVFGTTWPLTISRRMLCRSCAGRPPQLGCASCGYEGYELLDSTLNVTIPAGTASGSSVIVHSAGDVGERPGQPNERYGRPGPAGNLVVNVSVTSLEGVVMAGPDLIYDLPVDVIDALLGTLIHPALLDGPAVLAIPPGVEPGHRIKIPGRGVPVPNSTRGDAYLEVRIVMRTLLTTEQRALLESMRLPH